jgi:hypothetical protein
MSLSDLASVGSFISGVAVLISFGFLALQLRQGNVNQRALIQMGRNAGIIDVIYRRLDPRLQAVLLRGNRGDASMSPDEIDAYLQMNYGAFLNFENTYLQAAAGTIHPGAWETSRSRLRNLLAAPGYRVCWKKWRANFRSDFAEIVDQLVLEARQSGWEETTLSWAADLAEEKRLSAR